MALAPLHTIARKYVAMFLAQLGSTGGAQIDIAELTWRPGHAAISATLRLASDKGARKNTGASSRRRNNTLRLDVAL